MRLKITGDGGRRHGQNPTLSTEQSLKKKKSNAVDDALPHNLILTSHFYRGRVTSSQLLPRAYRLFKTCTSGKIYSCIQKKKKIAEEKLLVPKMDVTVI